ncbi:phosphatidylinositol-specific phospholipase C [Rhodococcus sp. NPDC054953]
MAKSTRALGGSTVRALLIPLAALLLLTAPPAAAAPGSTAPDLGSASGSVAPGDLASADNPDWMSLLPDDVGLSELSLPGTHDTMAHRGSIFAQTQDADLPTQLRAGVRVLDVRTRHFRDAFPIHHGIEYLDSTFTDVVVQVTDFLRSHPTEAVVMRLKEEYTAAENTRTYEDTLQWYIDADPATRDRLQQHLWRPPAGGGDSIPTLGAARGKVVLLQNFAAAATYGPRWGGDAMDIQDSYELTGLDDLDRKWDLIRTQFDRAAAGPGETFFVNHLSATGVPAALVTGTVPVTVARGVPGVTGILDRTEDHLAEHPTGRTGVVMADFPTADLVDALVDRNFR